MSTMSLADGDLMLRCMVASDVDKECVCFLSGGGPEMNTDISGPGVRISFYLQAYFLSLLSARSGSIQEITGALYTLIATNVAMTVASFILGFKPEPTMSLHDAIVVFYLLSLSWASVFTSMPAYNRFVRSDKTLQVVSMVQSYLIFALALAVLIKAPTFGSTPYCNTHTVAIVFKQFPALNAGRIAAFVVLAIVIIIYTFLGFTDYRRPVVRRYRALRRWFKERNDTGQRLKMKVWILITYFDCFCVWRRHRVPSGNYSIQVVAHNTIDVPPTSSGPTSEDKKASARPRKRRNSKGKNTKQKRGDKHEPSNSFSKGHPTNSSKSYDAGVFGTLLVELIVITILWALFVMNTELLILRNHFDGGGDGAGSELWQFGQILPMFLVVLPLVNLIKVFRKLGLIRRFHRRRVHKRHTRGQRREARLARADADLEPDEEMRRDNGLGSKEYSRKQWSYAPDSSQTHAAGLGNWPMAHISLHSIHSDSSVPANRDKESKVSRNMRRRRDSASSMSSPSSSSPSSSSSSNL